MSSWFETMWSDETLYLTVSCIVSVLLVAMEYVLLKMRERAILGHLGWYDRDLDRSTGPGDAQGPGHA